ncbi:hypothetical protein [Antrihabitans spumae]|uniref:Ig-like domain-containing protein n=1 Tax=Antrihabitans spumae TaxID=3373370 RepID=A0ABW7KCL7_9NOCA
MQSKLVVVLVGALALILSACGVDDAASDSSPSSVATATTEAATSTPVALPAPTTVVETAPATIEPEPATIVGCQSGYNPVETTWSDGTVTGYSDYCQNVRDVFVQGQIVPDSGPTEYVCESGLPCGITEEDGVVCDDSGCHSTR